MARRRQRTRYERPPITTRRWFWWTAASASWQTGSGGTFALDTDELAFEGSNNYFPRGDATLLRIRGALSFSYGAGVQAGEAPVGCVVMIEDGNWDLQSELTVCCFAESVTQSAPVSQPNKTVYNIDSKGMRKLGPGWINDSNGKPKKPSVVAYWDSLNGLEANDVRYSMVLGTLIGWRA